MCLSIFNYSQAATAFLPVSEPPVAEEEDSDEEVEELDPPKVLGDLLESLAGAVFLDSGMNLETVWRVFSPLFQSKIGMPAMHTSIHSTVLAVHIAHTLQTLIGCL